MPRRFKKKKAIRRRGVREPLSASSLGPVVNAIVLDGIYNLIREVKEYLRVIEQRIIKLEKGKRK